MAWAPALPLSMALEAVAGVFMALAAPAVFMAAAVEPSHSVGTVAAALAELLPGVTPVTPSECAPSRRVEQREHAHEGDDDATEQDFRRAGRA